MTLDQIISAFVYLGGVVIIFALGKFIFDKINPRFNLREELVEKDNFAVALAVTGYYMGLVFVIGGTLEGPSNGIWVDLFDLFFFGIIAIVLLNISAWLNDKIILRKFDNTKEMVTDRNAGTGIVVAGHHIANGLILHGAISGEGGDLLTALGFWLLGQVTLIIASLVYDRITPYDLHAQIEKDNVAVGIAFSGVLIALGNIINLALLGDFYGWEYNLFRFASYAVLGIVLLPIVRFITDKVLLPGRRLTDELVNQDKPNLGAGTLEAFAYVAASFIISWII